MRANGEGTKEAQFRNQLMATLKDKGLEDVLKKELRTKILEQLKNPHHSKPSESDSLFVRVVVSLVAEYMQIKKFSYSHSVFLPEVGYEGKILTRPELNTLFSIEGGTVGEESSLLEYFCGLQLPGSTPSQNQACQTNEFEIGYTLEERMELIDQKHMHLKTREPKQLTRDPALLRKEVEVQLKQHYDRQIRRFREFELETVRLEEFERARKRTDEMKVRLEQTYRRKCEDLRKRQRRLLDEHEKQVRELELQRNQHEDYMKKQKDLLELRQRACIEQSKLSTSQRQVEQEKYRRLQQQLQHKIQEYDKLNIKAADTIKYEVNLVRLAIQKEYQDKQMLTLEHKKAVDEEYYKMMSIKDSVETITRQNNRLVEENRELRKEVQSQRHRNQQIFDETKQNIQRVQYAREEKAQLEKELARTQNQLEKESTKTQKLQQELSLARRQLDEARDQAERLKGQLQSRELEQQPNPHVPTPTPQRRQPAADDLHRKMEQLRRQRKKQIERMKLELLN